MLRRTLGVLLTGLLGAILWTASAAPAQAQQYNLTNFSYYPYYYYPHSYWPIMGPRWPEPVGTPYVRPPAYMQFPAMKVPDWRFEYWEPQTYHRGFHFLLDVF